MTGSTIDLLERDYDGVFAFTNTGSAIPTRVSIDPTVKNVASIWLTQYEIRGVPVTAGVPNTPLYYLDIGSMCGIPKKIRIKAVNFGAGDSVPLSLNGEVTRYEYQYPIQIAVANNQQLSDLSFQLLNADGSPAVYDSATVHLTFSAYQQQYTLQDVIHSQPQVARNFNTRARFGYTS